MIRKVDAVMIDTSKRGTCFCILCYSALHGMRSRCGNSRVGSRTFCIRLCVSINLNKCLKMKLNEDNRENQEMLEKLKSPAKSQECSQDIISPKVFITRCFLQSRLEYIAQL